MNHDYPRCALMRDDVFERASLAQVRAIARRRKRRAKPRAASPATPQPGSPTQRQGRAAEMRARRYLEARGLRIVACNLRCKAGEIDLVALDGAVLVFVEVRERRNTAFGGAAASVNRRKQARLLKAAQYFLPTLTRLHCRGQTSACRFDVVSIEAGAIDWLPSAFTT